MPNLKPKKVVERLGLREETLAYARSAVSSGFLAAQEAPRANFHVGANLKVLAAISTARPVLHLSGA